MFSLSAQRARRPKTRFRTLNEWVMIDGKDSEEVACSDPPRALFSTKPVHGRASRSEPKGAGRAVVLTVCAQSEYIHAYTRSVIPSRRGGRWEDNLTACCRCACRAIVTQQFTTSVQVDSRRWPQLRAGKKQGGFPGLMLGRLRALQQTGGGRLLARTDGLA